MQKYSLPVCFFTLWGILMATPGWSQGHYYHPPVVQKEVVTYTTETYYYGQERGYYPAGRGRYQSSRCSCPPGHRKNGKCRHQQPPPPPSCCERSRCHDHGHQESHYGQARNRYPARHDDGIVIEGGVRVRKRIPLPGY